MVDDIYPFDINYDMIIRADDLMECTRDLARMIKMNPYISTGDYLMSLPNSILDELLVVADDEEHDNFSELPLMSEILARAEGLDAAQDEEDSLKRLKMFIALIAVEGLGRKGLIKVHRENYSLGEDMGNKPVASKLK